MEPRRGPPAVRHERQGVPRLRQRDRGHGARPRDIRGSTPRSTPRSTAHRADQRDRVHRAGVAAGDRAGGHLPRPARLGAVPQLGLGGDRRRPQAGPPRHRAPRDHRVPRRLPRPDLRRDERHDLEPQLPDRLRAAPAGRLLRAVPGRLSGVRRRRGGGVGRGTGRILRVAVRGGDRRRRRWARSSSSPSWARAATTRRRPRSCRSCGRCATSTASC